MQAMQTPTKHGSTIQGPKGKASHVAEARSKLKRCPLCPTPPPQGGPSPAGSKRACISAILHKTAPVGVESPGGVHSQAPALDFDSVSRRGVHVLALASPLHSFPGARLSALGLHSMQEDPEPSSLAHSVLTFLDTPSLCSSDHDISPSAGQPSTSCNERRSPRHKERQDVVRRILFALDRSCSPSTSSSE